MIKERCVYLGLAASLLAVQTGFGAAASKVQLGAAKYPVKEEARQVAAVVAALGGIVGAAVERWLFFAEARHVVNLYHGAQRC